SLVNGSVVTNILFDTSDKILVKKSAEFLASDIEKVTGKRPTLLTSKEKSNQVIIIGTLGSPLVNQLVARKKVDVSQIKGGWEQFILQTVKNPSPGIKEALVVVGSDKRGAAFGTFTISEKIGV